jgi:hypothetical protein
MRIGLRALDMRAGAQHAVTGAMANEAGTCGFAMFWWTAKQVVTVTARRPPPVLG